MPNSNPQAIKVANDKIRPLADAMAGLYNALKSAQIEYVAEGWGTLFPNDAEPIVDGSATDGRTTITNAEIRAFMLTDAVGLINALEASAFAGRDRVFKIAPNPRVQ
jgi:hypothetical protein